LSRLANLNRIVNVSNLRMQGMAQKDEQPYSMKTDLILTAYTLDSASVPPKTSVDGKTSQPAAAQAGSKH